MVAELLQNVVIAKQIFDFAVVFGKQFLDGLAALRAVRLPEVGVQEPNKC